MSVTIIDNFTLTLDQGRLLKKLHLAPGSSDAGRVNDLLEEARQVAHPRAMYKEAYLEAKGEESVRTAGINFNSRVLRVNLEQAERVFPYVATAGTELEEWARSIEDMLESYWADAIQELFLRQALEAVYEEISENYHYEKMGSMNPGSLPDWPIDEQVKLFQLLEDPEEKIGVRLTDSYLMMPRKSVSGIRFPTLVNYENCQLCSREECPGRRAAYDQDLYEKRYSRD